MMRTLSNGQFQTSKVPFESAILQKLISSWWKDKVHHLWPWTCRHHLNSHVEIYSVRLLDYPR